MDLPEFLLARLAEDFEVAQRENTWPNGKSISATDWDRVAGDADSMLVGMFSPARVLAEVEAKRKIVSLHRHVAASPTVRMYEEKGERPFGCVICADHDGVIWPAGWCDTLSLLALPHSEHDDYRAEWLPAVKA